MDTANKGVMGKAKHASNGARRPDAGKGDSQRINNGSGVDVFKDTVPLEIEGLDPRFNLSERILSDSGVNAKHFRDEYGAKVYLAGKGSGRLEPDSGRESRDPLHVRIECDSRDALEDAIVSVSDLVDHVLGEYYEWVEQEEDGGSRGAVRGRGVADRNDRSSGTRGRDDRDGGRQALKQKIH